MWLFVADGPAFGYYPGRNNHHLTRCARKGIAWLARRAGAEVASWPCCGKVHLPTVARGWRRSSGLDWLDADDVEQVNATSPVSDGVRRIHCQANVYASPAQYHHLGVSNLENLPIGETKAKPLERSSPESLSQVIQMHVSLLALKVQLF